MSEELKRIAGFKVTRISKGSEETIQADECPSEGSPSVYVFLRQGKEIERVFVHALEREPVPVHPASAEFQRALSARRDQARARTQKRNLKRE